MAKLVDLNPGWLSNGGEDVTQNGQPVPYRERIGMAFDCPDGCGDRMAIVFANPPDGGPSVQTKHAWTREGDTFETLTLKPSIQRMSGCRWHGFLTAGVFTNA